MANDGSISYTCIRLAFKKRLKNNLSHSRCTINLCRVIINIPRLSARGVEQPPLSSRAHPKLRHNNRARAQLSPNSAHVYPLVARARHDSAKGGNYPAAGPHLFYRYIHIYAIQLGRGLTCSRGLLGLRPVCRS